MNKIIYISFLSIFAIGLSAQQEIILTKYTYNSLFFNPAYAGSHTNGEGTLLAHYRNQWLALDGAPTTFILGAESSFVNDRVGLGLTLAKETIGIENRIDVSTNYAYRIALKNGYLAGGLRLGLSNYRSDFSKIIHEDPNDPYFARQDISFNVLSAGAGIYYNTKDLYVGISSPAIATVNTNNGSSYRVRHYYVHGGIMIGDEYSTIKVEPSILLKFQEAVPVQFTFGANIWLKERLAIGGHWRFQDALALSLEIKLTEKIRMAMAYDFTLSQIRNYSNGTIEFMMGYSFSTKPKDKRIQNIRHGGRF